NFRFLRVEYWSWTERVSFLILACVGWAALGIAGAHVRALERFEQVPGSAIIGSFGGRAFADFVNRRLPNTPERDLLLEINQIQSEPGGKSIQPPTYAQMQRAFTGGGAEHFPLWAAGGALLAAPVMQDDFGRQARRWTRVLPVFYALIVPLALAVF